MAAERRRDNRTGQERKKKTDKQGSVMVIYSNEILNLRIEVAPL